ncbi:hypothetical protein [Planomonospora sp. ID82291]|uniref:hypothetical protein n=1 Tax=Planomonospora sp. ID82291 TaxID=2738136 RepID=UPI0018C3B286|nr:hypothetical protein [Planomonospora sp. ID82291]MBG0819075.1 hypothetical protein [Planomonospora sp. ID82291]
MPSAHVDTEDPHAIDIVTRISPAERDALGAVLLADPGEFTHAVVWALILLRTIERDGQHVDGAAEDLSALRGLIGTLERRLIPALHGIRDAAVRRHQDMGGSYGQLARAMGTPRSTAQSRHEALERRPPSDHERWATGTGGLRLPWTTEPTGDEN